MLWYDAMARSQIEKTNTPRKSGENPQAKNGLALTEIRRKLHRECFQMYVKNAKAALPQIAEFHEYINETWQQRLLRIIRPRRLTRATSQVVPPELQCRPADRTRLRMEPTAWGKGRSSKCSISRKTKKAKWKG